MPFIPHTPDDVTAMLGTIGAASIDALFDEIPPALKSGKLKDVPEGAPEMAVTRLMHERAAADGFWSNFIGAGVYEHHIPAAIWQITTRGEFYSAYTPYQAEASQGTLQLIYEYQTMMTRLTGLDASNASLYDGASALAEAVLMAVRANKGKSRRVLIPKTVHPTYRKVVLTTVKNQGIELVELDYDAVSGTTVLPTEPGEFAGLVIPQPNFFGVLEDVHAMTDWAHAHHAMAIALVNPTSLAVLEAPGNWGQTGADIACGEGQPLGAPMASGGPYFGFMCCRQDFVRQMPGRIVGRTVDLDGKPGFSLTLQAREQHIRRSKATSNICTNQGLVVTAATQYMSLLGPAGLAKVASASHANTVALADKLCAIPGVKRAFTGACFHEVVLQLDDATLNGTSAANVLRALRAQGILGGYDLTATYPELGNAILVCVTETKTVADLDAYASQLARILSSSATR
ncbi:MAG: glycine dehydrogenase (aminomethyl-transferring) [Hydrogenophilales bacterium 16-64-46]|nr:MAG: glycine dehydrogenase (aminomethyl-transferring) [Hydrogenophilales bacterium 12-64-13]OYZ06601.1 MAG: glycine dehydrogenase (aminomethyl-transferring) [Hydrogenophilales bacterium 16-64-46]OZA39309.1 MAG: glycine dehydrogenase (aminomethyl-transferring) [Hydrogenophilales bacterium 17-64-34]HQS98866.1 aminomethyl-transferring glycine dehydrogenase subunit GcvPA [Thiobacillus sp.]